MKYDVFLSHNSSDKPHVRTLHDWLSRNGVRSFLDENDLKPGDILTDKLGEAMDKSSSAIICIGEHGEGPWHGEEMNTLLGRSLKMARTQNEFRLIPVLLPNADTTSMRWFLQTRLWVDLSGGIDGADAELFRLRAAIMGEQGPPVKLDSGLNPYRGLEAFRVEDGRFFFGRTRESVELAEKVRRSRFCVITGPSGNGKSSLARAGLNSEAALKVLPELAVWKRVTFKPGQGFLRSLLLQLHSHLPSEQRGPLVDKAIASIMPPVGFPTAESWAEAVNQHLEAFFPGDDETVLLLVDQFEEIFTHRGIGTATESDCLDRARLVMDGLARLREYGNRRWRILLTVRSDFYQRCRVSEPFWSLLEKEHLRLELDELNEDGWREAIKGPASRAGAYLEAGLVETMMKDVYRQRGSMPLLQLALQSLWNLREGACLTHAAYLKVGGVTNALQQRAESCLENLKDENSEYFAIARNLLLRLISPGEGVGDTRRRAERREFEWVNTDRLSFDYVLQELTSTENRLLVTDGESVEIVHEVLIRDCPTIRGWIELARPEIPMLRRLTHAAYRWEDNKRDAIFLSPADPPRELKRWIRSATLRLTSLEREFWESSRSARGLVLREKRHAQQALIFAQNERFRASEDARIAAEAAASRNRTRSRVSVSVSLLMIIAVILFVRLLNTSKTNETIARNARETAENALADLFYERIGGESGTEKEEATLWDLTTLSDAVKDRLVLRWSDSSEGVYRGYAYNARGFRSLGLNRFADIPSLPVPLAIISEDNLEWPRRLRSSFPAIANQIDGALAVQFKGKILEILSNIDENDPGRTTDLSNALAAIVDQMDAQSAYPIANDLLKLIENSNSYERDLALSVPLVAISKRLDGEIGNNFARILEKEVSNEAHPNDLHIVSYALSKIPVPLDEELLEKTSVRIYDKLLAGGEAYSHLASLTVSSLIDRMSPESVDEFAECLRMAIPGSDHQKIAEFYSISVTPFVTLSRRASSEEIAEIADLQIKKFPAHPREGGLIVNYLRCLIALADALERTDRKKMALKVEGLIKDSAIAGAEITGSGLKRNPYLVRIESDTEYVNWCIDNKELNMIPEFFIDVADIPVEMRLWILDQEFRNFNHRAYYNYLIKANLEVVEVSVLVDVLKWPSCGWEVQKLVLTAIENSPGIREKGAKFNGNLGTFVELAPSLGITNLDSPPKRPTLEAAIARWTEWRKSHPVENPLIQ